MILRNTLPGLIFMLLSGLVSPLWAQSPVQYVHDALGRVSQLIDPSGNVATYNYDAVGNLLSITRSTTSPSGLAISSFSPGQGNVGQTVVIQGQNFSATLSANTVQFNGTLATATAATANSLTTTVPSGATTGPISVTVGTSTATSSANFTVVTTPVISSISPTLVLNTPTVSFTVNGSNLTGATFSFLPAFSPAAITASNVNINGGGTSTTMTLTLASSANGSFTIVATTSSGSSSQVPSASNTLTVLSTNPSADFDGDGLTNIYEAAIGTNYANFSTTNDLLPDGWALFYTSTPPLSSGLAGQTAPNGSTYLQDFQQGLNPLIRTVAPSVSNIFPANLATNYPTNGVIVVRFTEPLQAGVTPTAAQNAINAALPSGSNFSTANAAAAGQILQAYLNRTCCGSTAMPGVIQISQGGRNVNGSVFLSDDHLSLTFVPNQFFSASTTYTVTVQAVKDAGGNLMAQPFQSTFTTGLSTVTTTGGVTFTNPANNATGVQTNAPIQVNFSQPVNPLTLTSSTFVVTDQFTRQPVPGTIQVDPSLLSASFVPTQPYGVGRSILVDLTAGIENFANGSFFPAQLLFSFTTAFVSNNQGPTLLNTSPADQATNIPLNALVVLQFNEPIDALSALKGLQVQQAGVPIPGAIALSSGNAILTFTPSAALAANTTYLVVTTDELTDFAGNPLLNPDSSTFTTGTASDTTSPTVGSVSPDNTTTGVPTNTAIQLTFSKQIDPLSVTTASFTVSPNASLIPVPGSIAVSSNGLIATFTPSVALDPSTTYEVLATNAINDLEGHPLTQFPSTFTTASGTVTTAPTVAMVSPPNGATGVQVNARVEVVLSAPLAPSTVSNSSITLVGGGLSVPGTVTLSASRTTLTFVPTSLLSVSTTYTVTVSGPTDVAGNPLTTFTSSFTTGTSGTADTSALTVSVNPASGATNISVNSPVVLTFNKSVDPTTVSNATIAISNSGSFSPVLAGHYSVSGAVVTFTPLTPMPGNANTNVGVFANGVKDFAGNTISSTFSSSFTTGSEGSTSGPTVTVVPNNGATAIGLNSTVVLTFSESLNQTTINTTNFGLLANGGKLPISIGRSADNRVVTLSTNSGILPASSTITVVATSGVLDLYGNTLANFTSAFTTAAAFDTTHPSVIAQRPGNSATGVNVNTSVVLYVSEPMNAATVPGALHVSQNGVLVAGTAQVTDSGQTIQFTPSSPFANDALVQVFLDTTAQDVDGNSLSAYQGSFTTAISTAAVSPSVVSSSPASGASSVPTNVIIDVAANETLNPTTVNTSTVTLTQNSSTISATVSLLPGGTIIQIVPTSALAANTTYFFNLKTGIQGTNGLAFVNNSIGFTTGAGTDTTQPALNSVSPPNGSTGVGNNSAVRLVFNKGINPLTVNVNTVQLTSGGTTQVFDAMTFFSNNQSVLLIPHGPLPDSTVMTLTISGITDLVGNAVPTQTTHFTTGIGPDVLVPVVLSTSPSNNESGVPLNAVVQARMNEPVDPGTVTSSALTLTDNTANQTVNGTPSLSTDGLTVSFLPGTQLAAGHNFTVAFGNQILKDLVGNGLVSPGGPPNFIFAAGTSSSTAAPQVIGVSPPSALTSVPVNAQVLIQFNEPIDPLSIGQVTLSSTGGNVIVATTVTNGNEFLILDPVVPLSQNTAYTVTVTGVQDLSGNVMTAQATSSFTTGTAVDLTLPAEQSVSPTNGATGVLTTSAIQMHFNKRIDPLTATNTTTNVTFTVAPTSTQQPIAGTIMVSADGLTLTFTPSSALATSTVYQISATSGITDLEGQALTAFSSTFTTGTQ